MVTKGGQMPVALLEEMSARSGRPVMIAALLHNSTNPQAVFDDLDAISAANAARAQADRPGLVLPADDGLHARLALPGRRPGELEAGAGRAGRGADAPCSPTRRSATACAPSWPRRRCSASSTASGTRCRWSRPRDPRHRELEQRSIAELAADAGPRPARRRCSTWRSPRTCAPSSPRSCSTATKRPWAAC